VTIELLAVAAVAVLPAGLLLGWLALMGSVIAALAAQPSPGSELTSGSSVDGSTIGPAARMSSGTPSA
jgi:hypothetical protein